jgi:flagellar biosynthetic protein FliP
VSRSAIVSGAKPLVAVVVLAFVVLLSASVHAAPAAPTVDLLSSASGPGLAPQLKVLALLTLLSLLPAIVLTMTSFTRFVVVLSFVKQGLGAQQTPPPQVLIGIALFMTMFTMAPVTQAIMSEAYEPYAAGKIDETQAMARASTPLRAFMLRQTREADLALFYDAARQPMPATEEEVPMRIASPAFVVSELSTAFQMGVLVLLPFLVIDLAVASILMAMGMMMVPPSSISLPLKLLLFVVVDGWHLLVGSLLRSFA